MAYVSGQLAALIKQAAELQDLPEKLAVLQGLLQPFAALQGLPEQFAALQGLLQGLPAKYDSILAHLKGTRAHITNTRVRPANSTAVELKQALTPLVVIALTVSTLLKDGWNSTLPRYCVKEYIPVAETH